jgi:hypothetical protein
MGRKASGSGSDTTIFEYLTANSIRRYGEEESTQMALETRQNPESGVLEVLVDGEWVRFEDYRRVQIDEAYLNSIKFLRERLGESEAQAISNNEPIKEDP